MTLARRWPLTGHSSLRDELLVAWSEASRGYHDLTHLTEVLDRLDELAEGGVGYPRVTVLLAAWFHDAVYDGLPDAEERSARWAERALADQVDPGVTDEVARLVRLTRTHRPDPGDVAGEVLCDADLAILAAAPERYARYVAGVRTEYAAVPDGAFRAGRGAVLRDLLAKPTLFHTAYAREHWEGPARANVLAELGEPTSDRPAGHGPDGPSA